MKGPKEIIIKYNSCMSCEELESNMIKSGMNPIREYKCKDKNAKPEHIWLPKGYIGNDSKGDIKTPTWCPYLK